MAAAKEDLTVVPDPIPRSPVRLFDCDCTQRNNPGMHMCFVLRSRLDQKQLQESFARLVSKNPEIAGRIRTVSSQLEIFFSGPVGCPFRVRPLEAAVEDEIEGLNGEAYVKRALEVQRLLAGRADIASVGSGEFDTIDKGGPLCMLTYCPGARISVLAMSLCHLVGDGWVFFELVRCLEEEYSGRASTPLTGRVDYPIHDFLLANVLKIVPVVFSFFSWVTRGRPPLGAVLACMSESQYAAFKEREAEAVPSPLVTSKNDAFVAWLANVLGSKMCIFPVDGRGAGVSAAPARCSGNAFFVPVVLPASSSRRWSALDIRRAVSSLRSDNSAFTFQKTGLIFREDICSTSNWLKVQHLPQFGGSDALLSCIGDVGWFNHPLPVAFVHRSAPGELVVVHVGLEKSQMARLKAAYHEAGIATVAALSSEDICSTTEFLRRSAAQTNGEPVLAGSLQAVYETTILLLGGHLRLAVASCFLLVCLVTMFWFRGV